MILIVDDFESEINYLKGVLTELDFTDVVVAYDGQQAIEILSEKSGEIVAVITDFNMPNKNGAEVIKVAKSLGIEKILLRSSHSVSTLRQRLMDAAINPLSIEIVNKQEMDRNSFKDFLKSFILS